jgi:hypothetical protein
MSPDILPLPSGSKGAPFPEHPIIMSARKENPTSEHSNQFTALSKTVLEKRRG